MAKTNGFKAQQFIEAIPKSGGVISIIAKRVGCAYNTAKKYIENYPTVKQAFENERYHVDDAARSIVIEDIVNNKSIETAKWWLRVKIPEEFAPANKTDLTSGGKPITVIGIGINTDEL